MKTAEIVSAAVTRPQPAAEEPDEESSPLEAQGPFWRWWAVLSGAALISPVLIGRSYRNAIVTGRPSYLMFWAGVLVFMLPVCVFVASRRARRNGLLCVLAATGLILYIPKILRNPFGPLYHDELAHWRQVQDIAAHGHLFVSNTTIPIISSYPGLHIVALTMQELTGLSTWAAAMVLLALLHVIDLIAVCLIVEGFTRSWRVGAVGGIIYSLNSSYMYFHTQFAYESLGVTLVLVTILAVQHVERAESERARRQWGALAAIVGATCAVTHHLSTVTLCLVLIAWSVVALRRGRRGGHITDPGDAGRTILAVTGFVIAFLAAWITLVAPSTVTYLQPYIGQAVSQLTTTLGGGHGGRAPFSANTNPLVERVAAFASPLLALIAACLTVRYLRRHRRNTGAAGGYVTLFAFGLLYFPSIPFLLTASGAEGARRTWGFTYLGVALILAPTLARWLRRSRGARPRARLTMRALLACAFVVVLVGNVAAGLDESYRFPGPYALGSDTGSQTPELAALSQWFLGTVGTDNKVVADRFTGLALGTVGRQVLDAPSGGFPTYQLWLNRTPPSPALVAELSSSEYQYLVIDKRMALPVDQLGDFFANVGASSDGTTSVTAGDLDRFGGYGWLTRVYESPTFVVYRFQYGSQGLPVSRA